MAVMPEVDVWVIELFAAAKQDAREESHAALRAILRQYTDGPLSFALAEHGKPYLPAAPELKFNLSHSHGMALVAVAREVEIGVDVERFRALPECLKIAERFFPPSEFAALAEVAREDRDREFFRRWTGIEATLKARGVGLFGAGLELEGEWSVVPVDVGPDYAASVAANCGALTVRRRELARP
jgi:phosphopantetheinyl transferase